MELKAAREQTPILRFVRQAERGSSAGGFTLVELIVVILLIVTLSSLALSRLDSASGWQQKNALREFGDTWQMLLFEALNRRDAYRLIIDLDANSYFVRREVPLDRDTVIQVDYLKNLRTKSEKERRKHREEDQLLSLDDEYRQDEIRQNGPLEELFYQTVFADPNASARLAVPTEFPGLAQEKVLPPGLFFKEVETSAQKAKSGQIVIRFSPRGASEYALVRMQAGDQTFTIFVNPATGSAETVSGDADFEWLKRKTAEAAEQ